MYNTYMLKVYRGRVGMKTTEHVNASTLERAHAMINLQNDFEDWLFPMDFVERVPLDELE